jgi:hypothetical protein
MSGQDQLWIADITYLRLKVEFVYLAVILDAFSRKAVGSRRLVRKNEHVSFETSLSHIQECHFFRHRFTDPIARNGIHDLDTETFDIAATSDQHPSASGFHDCFSLSLQPLTQSLLSYQSATAHSNCRQVFVLNRVIEEPKRKASHLSRFARSIRHSR